MITAISAAFRGSSSPGASAERSEYQHNQTDLEFLMASIDPSIGSENLDASKNELSIETCMA